MKRARHGTVLPLGSTVQFALLSKSCGLMPLSGYGPIVFVNRLLRLPASGGDPHEEWCGLTVTHKSRRFIVEILP
jgi:hypothetical protein